MENVTIETNTKLAADAQPAKKTKSKTTAKGGKPARKAKAAKKAKPAKKPTAERANKKAEVIALMKRTKGATLDEIIVTTGWQRHTVRGFVSNPGQQGRAEDRVVEERQRGTDVPDR